MTPRLTDAKYVRGYILHLRFADGTEGDVDLGQELEGEVFEPIKDLIFFQAFTLSTDPSLPVIIRDLLLNHIGLLISRNLLAARRASGSSTRCRIVISEPQRTD